MLSERLKLAMTKAGMSQAELARACGVKPPSINGWLSGKSRYLRGENLLAAAKALNVSQQWLATGKSPMHNTSDETNIAPAPQRRPIPVISWVQAGDFCDIVDLHEAGLSDEWFSGYTSKLSECAFALVVQGESMVSPYPGTHSFPPGTRIIVDPAQVPAAGDFCLAKDVLAQTATFKKLHHEDGRWYLKPLNPAFNMIEIDDPSLRVIGKVVESYLQVRL